MRKTLTLRPKVSPRPSSVRVSSFVYTHLVSFCFPKHIFSCTMGYIASAALMHNGAFTPYECAVATHYHYADTAVVCEMLCKMGLIKKVYEPTSEWGMVVYKQTASVILHAPGKPNRPHPVTDRQALAKWVRGGSQIQFKAEE